MWPQEFIRIRFQMQSVESSLVELEERTSLLSTRLVGFMSQDILENLLDVSGRLAGIEGLLAGVAKEGVKHA